MAMAGPALSQLRDSFLENIEGKPSRPAVGNSPVAEASTPRDFEVAPGHFIYDCRSPEAIEEGRALGARRRAMAQAKTGIKTSSRVVSSPAPEPARSSSPAPAALSRDPLELANACLARSTRILARLKSSRVFGDVKKPTNPIPANVRGLDRYKLAIRDQVAKASVASNWFGNLRAEKAPQAITVPHVEATPAAIASKPTRFNSLAESNRYFQAKIEEARARGDFWKASALSREWIAANRAIPVS
jgi:hypothetical protein